MGEFEQPDWEADERAELEDEQRPDNREQREMVTRGRAVLDEMGRRFHPLAPTELQQRRLRRAQGRAERDEGDEAA